MDMHLSETAYAAAMAAHSLHAGQTRRPDGADYYENHIKRVVYIAHNLFAAGLSEEDCTALLTVAFLHDSIEDCAGAEELILRDERLKHSVPTIKLLSHSTDEDYMEYIKRIAADPIARRVKIADILHNLHDAPGKNKAAQYRKALDILWNIHFQTNRQ